MSLRATTETECAELSSATRLERRRSDDLHVSREPFLLTVSDLRKSFNSPAGDRLDVLRGIDFSAAPGEMIAVMGASGAGKSTLLQLLGGLEQADHGTIQFDQLVLTRAGDLELARFRRRNIGFVFQFHHLLGDLTAAENVALPLLIDRVPAKESRLRADQMLESFGIAEKRHNPAGHLSGGEQQRVAVARALITQPLLILADEPTGNLDAASGEDLAKSMLKYCRDRSAIVIVATHNRQVANLCNRILTIHDGKIPSA